MEWTIRTGFRKPFRVLAEGRRALVPGRERSGRRNLAQIRQEGCSGVDAAEQYRLQKRWACLTKCTHRTHSTHCGAGQGTAEEALVILQIDDTGGSRG